MYVGLAVLLYLIIIRYKSVIIYEYKCEIDIFIIRYKVSNYLHIISNYIVQLIIFLLFFNIINIHIYNIK